MFFKAARKRADQRKIRELEIATGIVPDPTQKLADDYGDFLRGLADWGRQIALDRQYAALTSGVPDYMRRG